MDDFLSWASSHESPLLVPIVLFAVALGSLFGVLCLVVVFPYTIIVLFLLAVLFLIREYRKFKKGLEGG
jgi:hypothetical protein